MADLARYKVTMTSFMANAVTGQPEKHEATDHVDIEHLDAYVADARTRWQAVSVSDEIDHGPAGPDGEYNIHPSLV